MARGTKRTNREGRYTVLLAILVVFLVAVAARLVYLQIVVAPAYAQQAVDQRMRDITLAPRRGSIYDREGEPLAVSMEARTIYAAPHSVVDPKNTAKSLAKVLGGKAKEYETKLTKDTGFVYIARKVDMNRAKALEDLDLQGIGFLEDSRRTYPSGELACQVLGFVGVDDDGLAGLEKHYDDVLKGEPGAILAERDPSGRPIPGGVMRNEDPVPGGNVVLTIDKDIQYQAQVELAAAVEKWKAKSGSVIVMDPRDGSIYAMASVPGFNPNSFGEADDAAYRNRPIADTFEPGSTVKSLTAASVIDKGLYGPDSMFRLPPSIKVGGRRIGESHPRPTVNWSLTEIVTNSSNVGAVKLGMALGPKNLYSYFDRFGLTEKTGVDFPGEAKGWLPPPEDWSSSTIGTVPFGQGVSMTPLQLARSFAAIANGGELVTPHFLLSLPEDPDADFIWPKKRAISEEAARATTEVMKHVVTDGTGTEAAVQGYVVAGKTGTAQKARTDGPGYAAGKYMASFFGYLPADDPQVLIMVILDEPSNAIYGGVVAAPTFSALGRFSVSHLKIPPSTAPPRSVDETATGSEKP
ncbi:MAG: penicillin-binding protein 2 [Coriobacteriia bacterium]|nr:penicillin-binding protein 2 [Coriobacteriia bacterium]